MTSSSGPVLSSVTVQRHRCHDTGVVLGFARIVVSGAGLEAERLHRHAAVAGVAELTAAHAEQIERSAHRYPHIPQEVAEAARIWRRAAHEAASVSPDVLAGRRVTLEQFYGPAFDPTTGTLRKPSTSELDGDFSERGFVVALLKPPYGLRPAVAGYRDERDLLTDVIADVLGQPDAATPIWHWTGDWCRYFDAGNEWWGAAAWTLPVGPNAILTVAASSTD